MPHMPQRMQDLITCTMSPVRSLLWCYHRARALACSCAYIYWRKTCSRSRIPCWNVAPRRAAWSACFRLRHLMRWPPHQCWWQADRTRRLWVGIAWGTDGM